MKRNDNYLIQANQAKACFLTYDQDSLIRKLHLRSDEQYLYTALLHTPYRICRATGDLSRLEGGQWVDANSYEEVMTLLDLVCDSREDRFVSGRWKNMADFGLMFHQNLLENARDPWAEKFQKELEAFRRACRSLGGEPLPNGDAAYALELFDGLRVAVQLWLGDEDFPANLRILWDENANLYIRYETMYFAKALLLRKIAEKMEEITL